MYHLSKPYFKQRRCIEAEPVLVRVVEIEREVLGERHSRAFRAMEDLALVLWENRDRRDDAMFLLEECRQLERTLCGPEDPWVKMAGRILEHWKYQQAT